MLVNHLSRRELLETLAVLAAGARTASGAGSQGHAIHHVSLCVSDVARSSEFYHRVFGLDVQNRADGTVRLRLTKGSIILRRGTPAGNVDHFAIGIDGFTQELVTQDLKSRGAEPGLDEVAGLHVKDPDGIKVQLIDNADYAHPEVPSSFAGSRLDHVSIYCNDLQRSVEYYQRVFGCSVLKGATSTNLSLGNCYIGLRAGNSPRKVDHFAIGIDHFDEAAVMRELRARGAEAKNQLAQRTNINVLDPDGYLVQVTAPFTG